MSVVNSQYRAYLPSFQGKIDNSSKKNVNYAQNPFGDTFLLSKDAVKKQLDCCISELSAIERKIEAKNNNIEELKLKQKNLKKLYTKTLPAMEKEKELLGGDKQLKKEIKKLGQSIDSCDLMLKSVMNKLHYDKDNEDYLKMKKDLEDKVELYIRLLRRYKDLLSLEKTKSDVFSNILKNEKEINRLKDDLKTDSQELKRLLIFKFLLEEKLK